MPFPKEFIWGAATSSYQIEGAVDERDECVWDRFCHTWPAKIVHGDTGDIACDHVHRFREDVALMSKIGLQAYRFSIAWARGLAFYDQLVDELLKANIQPYATLYHWDLPQALQNQGGWANPDSVKWFADYADSVTRKLGDRVQGWMTHNEPWIVAFVGHYYGGHPPGIADLTTAYAVAHHLLLAHGAAVAVIRQNAPGNPVGIALNLNPAHPVSPQPEHIEAARRQDGFLNRWFLDPLFKGTYPEDILALVADHFPKIDVSEVKAAAVPIDFLGVNYYLRNVIENAPEEHPLKLRHIAPENAEKTALGWEIYPDGLTELLVRLHREYAPKSIFVTENGAAFDDPAPKNGMVDDPQRIAYLEGHFAAVERAIEQGVPMAGYFVWSLLDNFEWTHGYDKRFGLIYVDYTTQQRTLKKSAWYYRNRILNGLSSSGF